VKPVNVVVRAEIPRLACPAKLASVEVIVDQTQVAQLRIVDAKPGTLLRESGMLFKVAEGQAVADVEKIQVQGGALEGSNVNAVRELTDMIMASRLFESFQKSQESGSRMSELRNSRVGSVNG
jgi:flagellar basal body rod protein FlgG